MNTRIAIVAAVSLGCVAGARATDYYVDSIDGNDLNAGTSAETAWQTLGRLNDAAAALKGGDRVLFRRGGEWRGTLRPGSGEKGNPIVYSTYGRGPKPILEQSVDRSRPEDWFSLGGDLWSTKRVVPKVGKKFWSGEKNPGEWSASFQQGAKGAVRVLEDKPTGAKFVRVALQKASPKGESSTLQLWGPEVADLPETMLLRMKVRASKPMSLANTSVSLCLQRVPWTAAVRGVVKGGSKTPLGTEWREVTALMERPQGGTLTKGRFHWSIGDLMPGDANFDIQVIEMCEASIDKSVFIERDAGILILNHGEKWGFKKMWGAHEIKSNLDFWYDPEEGTVVMKWPENPGKSFDSIEIAKTIHVVTQGGCHDVTYDGLCVRYGASHGFGGGKTENIIIRNCDIYWIGGGLQYWKTRANGERYPVRYGNGIEFWGTCRNNLVERNRLWQIYDAALTNQTLGDPRPETDVTWRDNVIWQAEYSFEYWNHDPRSFTGNILFEHNTCVDAGYCWSHAQRPNPNGAHLMFYDNAAATTNFVVRNNVFVRSTDRSTRMFNDWRMKNPEAHDGLEMYDNLYWIPENVTYEYHLAGRDRKVKPALKAMRFGAGAEEFAKYVAESGLDKGSVVIEPQFRDEANRDYRLSNSVRCPDGTVYGARDMPGLTDDQSL